MGKPLAKIRVWCSNSNDWNYCLSKTSILGVSGLSSEKAQRGFGVPPIIQKHRDWQRKVLLVRVEKPMRYYYPDVCGQEMVITRTYQIILMIMIIIWLRQQRNQQNSIFLILTQDDGGQRARRYGKHGLLSTAFLLTGCVSNWSLPPHLFTIPVYCAESCKIGNKSELYAVYIANSAQTEYCLTFPC